MFQLQALGSRRFQRGFERVNLHRPTSNGWSDAWCSMLSKSIKAHPSGTLMERRKLKLKAKL